MKNIFKKISAIAASALMVGMTMGVAAAASYPSPFVDDGVADVAIVYGTGDGVSASDLVYAGYIEDDLSGMVTTSGSTTAEGGDSFLIEGTSDKFNLGDNVTDLKTSLDDDELSTVLAKGTYTNADHDDFDYKQKITLGSNIQLTHFQDNDYNDEVPIVGFHIANGETIFNYTLSFTDDAEGVDEDWSGIVDSYLPLLGEEYYVLDMANATTSPEETITLLNTAASGTLNEGESTTISSGDQSYTVSITYIDTDSVILNINGVDTESLAAGQTQKLSTGEYIGVKTVESQGYAGGTAYVDFSVGSGKLVLKDGEEVELNSEKLSKTEYSIEGSDKTVEYTVTAYITVSDYDLQEIVLEWKLGKEVWISSGTEIVLPGFESVKFSMADFIVDAEEATTISGDSDKLTLSTTITDGDIDLDILYLNSSSTGIAGLGEDSDRVLVTNKSSSTGSAAEIELTLNESEDSYFVVTWISSGEDFESYAFELESVDDSDADENTTILNNLVSGGSDVSMDLLESDEIGNVKFTLVSASEDTYASGEYATINITVAGSSGTVYVDRLVTAEGLQMRLPVDDSDGSDGDINISATGAANPTSWTMNFTEEDNNENIASGSSFTVTAQISGTDGIEAYDTSVTDYETEDNSNLYVGYVESDLATKTLLSKPTSGLNDIVITYHGSEAYAEVYISETGVTFSSDSESSLGEVLVKDSEVSSVSSSNLIIVGGSCINSAAATLVGSSACEEDFTTATDVGSGQFLIESYTNPYSSSKIALLVAGYDAADTINAVTYLRTQDVDTTVGNKYVGTSSTSAELVVE